MKKIDVFELSDPADKKRYEELLNDVTAEIYGKEFAYMKDGTPKITVWYEKIDE
jgi:hypothetical protein